LLRDWRQRRRLSQLHLASEAEVSPRHLSFVETGRSRPSRELVLHLAEHLDIPLRERNALLLAAGYAPTYHETAFDAPEMQPVRDALDKVLSGHEPFPAVVVDRRWNLISANNPALTLLTDGVAPELLEPPANALRASLHPDGLAPRIVNFAECSEHLLTRLDRQVAASGDEELRALGNELRTYPVCRSDMRTTSSILPRRSSCRSSYGRATARNSACSARWQGSVPRSTSRSQNCRSKRSSPRTMRPRVRCVL
jgi:transcriptional regulator with XRE-family HTH domain